MEDVRTLVDRLARLQEVESAAAKVDAAIAAIPGRLAAIEATLEAAEKALAEAKAAHQETGKHRRSLEQDIDSVKSLISKHQDQLMQVKTNEQYRALNKEIAHERSKIEEIEEKILLGMERADDLAKTIKDREAALAREKDRVATEKKVISEEQRVLEQDRSTLGGERDGILATLDAATIALFRRVAGLRQGVGVARIDRELCGECRVRIRPRTLQEANGYERMIQCESCQRILVPVPGSQGSVDTSPPSEPPSAG